MCDPHRAHFSINLILRDISNHFSYVMQRPVFNNAIYFLIFLPLDESVKKPIIERNLTTAMNSVSVTLIIVVLLAVLIIKDQFVVRMAKVKVK